LRIRVSDVAMAEVGASTQVTVNVSIVIVTWNGKRVVSQCLESLLQYGDDASVQIIVVDNASTDGTPEMVRELYPHVQLIQNRSNLGFAKANNLGIEQCRGKYVALINSDVKVPSGCLEKMIDYMDQNPTIGMLGPKMLLRDGSIGDSCMRFPTPLNWLYRALALDRLFRGSGKFGGFLMWDFRYDRVQDVDVLTGWFWLVRREALAQVGVLDERYFFYGEDIDWSKCFHDAGWRVVFYPEAEALHDRAASSSREPTRFYIEMNRANLQYCRKHHGRLAQIGFWLTTCLHEITRIVGYAAVYLLHVGRNPAAGFKVKRSAACLLWLMGLKPAP
jgi:GT2 family glycosyltransferase